MESILDVSVWVFRFSFFYKNSNNSLFICRISERLLNEALSDIENDFTAGVSKFVDDFLELEIKT